jgi:hypothetical protein
MFDLCEIHDRTREPADSTWRRFEALRAADARPAAAALRLPPPPTPTQPNPAPSAPARRLRWAGALGAGLAGGAAGLAVALAALAAVGPGAPQRHAPAPVAMIAAASVPATAQGPRPPTRAVGDATAADPPRRVAPPAAPSLDDRAPARIAPPGATADAPPTPTPRPVAAAPWLVVHVAEATGKAGRIVASLRAAGFGTVRIRQVAAGVARPDLRYFHEADRAAATTVQRIVGAELPEPTVRDFTHYRPLPEPGLIEIWID